MGCNCGNTHNNCSCDCSGITLPIGPTGATGATGPTGPTGATGASSWHMELTNEAMVIPGNRSGVALIPSGTHSTLRLFNGITPVVMNPAYLTVTYSDIGITSTQAVSSSNITITIDTYTTLLGYGYIDFSYADPTGGTFIARLDIVLASSAPGMIYRGESTTDPLTPLTGDWYRNPITGICKYYDGSAWQLLVRDGGAGATTYTVLAARGLSTSLTTTDARVRYYSGTATLSSNVTVTPAAGTWEDGATFKILYRANITTANRLVGFFGVYLTNEQALRGNITITATYVTSVGWNVAVTEDYKIGDIQKIWVTLTTTQLKALNASPVKILDSPGAGKYIKLRNIEAFLDYNSATYVGGDDLCIAYLTQIASTNFMCFIDNGLVTFNDDCIMSSDTTGANHVVYANEAVYAYAPTTDYTVGDSPIYLNLEYSIETLP